MYTDTQLMSVFNTILGWNKARAGFLALFITGLCKVQSVNFVRLAQGMNGNAKVESKLRRIQRFFAEFIIDPDMVAKLIMSLLPVKPPFRLCLDRTNWQFGVVDINILMLSIAHEGASIPLMWTMLNKKGNSNTKERKALLKRYINLFGAESISAFLADREFIGKNWFRDLIGKKVSFYIRIKSNMYIDVPGKGRKKAVQHFSYLKMYRPAFFQTPVLIDGQRVYLSGMRFLNDEMKIDYLIIASFEYNNEAFRIYKDRWQIETMFKAFKTNGFNLEDTHLSDLERISKLICLISIAYVCVVKVGVYRHLHIAKIKVKAHTRKAYSYFKYGLIFLANALLSFVFEEIKLFVKILSCT